MVLELFVVTLLHAEGVGRWGEWNCPKNSSTCRNSGGHLYGPQAKSLREGLIHSPFSEIDYGHRLIGSLHLRLLRMGKTKETIRIYPPILLCYESKLVFRGSQFQFCGLLRNGLICYSFASLADQLGAIITIKPPVRRQLALYYDAKWLDVAVRSVETDHFVFFRDSVVGIALAANFFSFRSRGIQLYSGK
jgi:hypothetical protein